MKYDIFLTSLIPVSPPSAFKGVCTCACTTFSAATATRKNASQVARRRALVAPLRAMAAERLYFVRVSPLQSTWKGYMSWTWSCGHELKPRTRWRNDHQRYRMRQAIVCVCFSGPNAVGALCRVFVSCGIASCRAPLASGHRCIRKTRFTSLALIS